MREVSKDKNKHFKKDIFFPLSQLFFVWLFLVDKEFPLIASFHRCLFRVIHRVVTGIFLGVIVYVSKSIKIGNIMFSGFLDLCRNVFAFVVVYHFV